MMPTRERMITPAAMPPIRVRWLTLLRLPALAAVCVPAAPLVVEEVEGGDCVEDTADEGEIVELPEEDAEVEDTAAEFEVVISDGSGAV